MPTADTRVATDRAARYLTQLCGHLTAIHSRHPAQRHGPRSDAPQIQTVTQSGTTGRLVFDRGSCRLEATDDALVLSAQAADPESLEQIKNALTHRLTVIGHRENLTVSWNVDMATGHD